MDWSNEPYVRVYTRVTDDDLALSFDAISLWRAILLLFDRSGVLQTRRGARGLAAVTRMPIERLEPALRELLNDGRLQSIDGGFIAPNFVAAQTAVKSDRLRQKELRDRRRLDSLSTSKQPVAEVPVTIRDVDITDSDSSVTRGHASSRDVTLTIPDHTDPILFVSPARTEPAPSEPVVPRETKPVPVDQDKWRAAIATAWSSAGLAYLKLHAEGVDRSARENAWNGLARGQIADRFREMREAHLEPYEALQLAKQAIETAVAQAKAERTLRWFVPERFFDAKDFGIKSTTSPAQAMQARAGPTSAEAPRKLKRLDIDT